jgi:hypothetical protein
LQVDREERATRSYDAIRDLIHAQVGPEDEQKGIVKVKEPV